MTNPKNKKNYQMLYFYYYQNEQKNKENTGNDHIHTVPARAQATTNGGPSKFLFPERTAAAMISETVIKIVIGKEKKQ